jgi:hypothetical protein
MDNIENRTFDEIKVGDCASSKFAVHALGAAPGRKQRALAAQTATLNLSAAA